MSDRLLVLNKDSDTVSYIDPSTGETTAVVETDFNPHEVAISPTTRWRPHPQGVPGFRPPAEAQASRVGRKPTTPIPIHAQSQS
jgi:YVTN family beta-propeller protein